jgi:hypothetical protein
MVLANQPEQRPPTMYIQGRVGLKRISCFHLHDHLITTLHTNKCTNYIVD